jgi:DNA-binding transcriptional regulator YiaG
MNPEEFKEIRQKTGLNQTQLSKEWGVTDRTVRRWEAGYVPISPTAAYCLRMMVEVRS